METVDNDATGHPVPGVKVGFVTGLGVRGSVFVPKLTYSVDNVKAAVAAAAAQIDAVHKLTG